jgi:hypothetical protein
MVAADCGVDEARASLATSGARVEGVKVHLSTREGVDRLLERVDGRQVEAFFPMRGTGSAVPFSTSRRIHHEVKADAGRGAGHYGQRSLQGAITRPSYRC